MFYLITLHHRRRCAIPTGDGEGARYRQLAEAGQGWAGLGRRFRAASPNGSARRLRATAR
ncbi:hypothetical protein [Streptomyces albipurpureus]|uniref:Transposase n=1 Tax=Streptomyces albipurpureus TaxID=2897419 RepID=A0ABT0UJD2_9ACTN|nr:hypothetical protein [Streptomyces sp. CWNU-1]MCM2387715.1 hypothetical protein [Streptomyces sp. CWNU-1]